MYSGGESVFTEADVFTIVIPLSEAATATVGPYLAPFLDAGKIVMAIPDKPTSRDQKIPVELSSS